MTDYHAANSRRLSSETTKRNLGAVLQKVSRHGQRVTITRHGVDVALLAPPNGADAQEASSVLASQKLKGEWTRALNEVSTGATFTITRRGKAVAVLRPLPQEDEAREQEPESSGGEESGVQIRPGSGSTERRGGWESTARLAPDIASSPHPWVDAGSCVSCAAKERREGGNNGSYRADSESYVKDAGDAYAWDEDAWDADPEDEAAQHEAEHPAEDEPEAWLFDDDILAEAADPDDDSDNQSRTGLWLAVMLAALGVGTIAFITGQAFGRHEASRIDNYDHSNTQRKAA